MWLDLWKPSMYAQDHFIAFYNSRTHALSRHSNKTAIDKQVCFYRWPFVNPVKSQKTILNPVRSLRDINRVIWGPFLFHCTYVYSARGMIRAAVAICLAHCAHNRLAVSTGIVNPPSYPHPHLNAALVILLTVFKTSLKTNQSNR